MWKLYKSLESILSSMKFAVVIISIFTVMLVYGTFQESYHGADWANRLVYKSWWFILCQFFMFMSILMATVVRMSPIRKRLYGFYTIHAGLIIIFVGSVLTYFSGIDGSVELLPNKPSRKIIVNNDFLRVGIIKSGKAFKLPLPYTAYPKEMNQEVNGIKVKEFIPFARLATFWEKGQNTAFSQGAIYQISNANVSQEFTLSTDPNSDFKSSEKMGPLSVHYLPKEHYECFMKESPSGFIIWNLESGECFSAEEKNLQTGKTPKGNRFLLIEENSNTYSYFPDFSPSAVTKDLKDKIESPFKVFSRNIFTKEPNLFLFGENIAYYNKRKQKWVGKTFKSKNDIISTPWMGFNLRLLKFENKTPFQRPEFTKPIMDQSQVIEGDIKAVKIEIEGQDYWVRSDAPLAVSNGKSEVRFMIGPEEIYLPYQITLNKFKMKKNPGTNDPASYESYVQLLDSRYEKPADDHHVFMNNPLKYDGFTFYQSSYFEMSPNEYGSVFSVNYDPGRPVKYAGSLLLVIGSMWHYFIRRQKRKIV